MKKIRSFLIVLVMILVSSCGYEAVYSTNNTKSNEKLLSVKVKNIPDRSGQVLRNSLRNQFNPNNKRVIPQYYLQVILTEGKEELGYRKDMSATRTNLIINAEYLLTEIKDGDIILDGLIKTSSSYDVVESIYATIIAEKDARNKSLKKISDGITTDLAIFFKQK